jgi:recombination protein RecR
VSNGSTDPVSELIAEFSRLPSIGRKTAQRLAFYLLKAPAEQSERLASAIREVRISVQPCSVCRTLSHRDPCSICDDPRRQSDMLCVVEESLDLEAIERTGRFHGRYHVLGGVLSPLDGIGPDELNLDALVQRAQEANAREVIVATNPTVEGEATAAYVARLLRPLGVKVTRIASGIPVGGDLEYADEVTMARALEGRSEL